MKKKLSKQKILKVDMTIEDIYYKNITISGLPGCGSTTLLSMLREKLKYAGFTGFSGGEFMRAYAAEKGLFNANSKAHHSALVYSDDFDRQVDMGIREKLSNEEGWIIESWLSGFMAQNIPSTLKILMVCSDDAVRIDRIVNRDEISVEEAKNNALTRYQDNLSKWQRMYKKEWDEWLVKTGKVPADAELDFWRPDIYDLVIDTYSHNQQETLKLALDAIKKKKK
ncbi:MAG TPA: cytidylate kinase family protein [Candidatus Woesebacteria bacterium]|nr:cytidylate kinase family protein [Candidatus Woesebacteria bacterium]